jgi:hypothetical protein
MRAYVSGRSAYVENRFAVAEREFRSSVELFASCDADVYRAFGLRYVGRLTVLRNDFTAGIAILESAHDLARGLGLSGFSDAVLGDLGEASAAAGDYERARAVLRRRLETARTVGYLPGIAESLAALAVTEWRAADLELGATLAHEAFATARTVGDHASAGVSLAVLGFVSARRDDLEDARRWHTEGVRHAHRFSQSRGAALALEGLAQVAVSQRNGPAAAGLLGAAAALRELPGQAVGPAFAVGLRLAHGPMLDRAARDADVHELDQAFFAGARDPERLIARALAAAPA